MITKSERFLLYWLLMLLALVVSVSSFDIIVDPYHVFDMPLLKGFNFHKTAAYGQEWLYKFYEVNRIKPKTILLGSSRVAEGMDTHSSSWPPDKMPLYNLGLEAGMPYASFRYLQSLMSKHAPESVVVGLDFEYFLNTLESQHTAVGDFESRLDVNADGSQNANARRQHALDFLQFALSYDALLDSFATVVGNLRGDPADGVGGNEPDEGFLRDSMESGTFPIMEWINVITVRRLDGARNQFAMADLQQLLDLCESHGTQVTLYIHPMPADTLEIIDFLGYWPMFEDWKRELLGLVSKYPRRKTGSQVVLWDFSDYDVYSTEAVRPDGQVLHWFWDSWHYTRALGDLIVKRMFGTSAIQFGTPLTRENIEPHLAKIRERRQEYRMARKTDVDRVKAVLDAEIQVLKSPALESRNQVAAAR